MKTCKESMPCIRPPSQSLRRVHLAGLFISVVGCFAGCGGSRNLELTGEKARHRLPRDVFGIIPEDAILRHEEEGEEGGYHLWILHKPGGKWITFPKRKGLEHHTMPTSALEAILQSKLPSLERGEPVERRCLYTHWTAGDGAEIQLREIITDQGWFASVERMRL